MRETLRIMSLDRWAYALSYFLKQGIFAVFTSIVLFLSFYFSMTVDLGKGNEGIDKNFRQYYTLFFGFVLFGLNIVALAMVLSAFFTDSKLSTQIGIFLMFLPTSLFFYSIISVLADSLSAVVAQKPYYGEQWLNAGYMLPHFTFGMVLLDFLVDHGFPKLAYKAILPLSMESVWAWNFLSIAIYLCLYIYLDAVIPNKYGVTKSYCFCIKDNKKPA